MKTIAAALTLAAVLVVSLTGCTASPAPSEDAVSHWVNSKPADQDSVGVSVVGMAAGLSDSTSSNEPGGGVTLEPPKPYSVTGLVVRCYGADSLSIHWSVSGATESMAADSKPVTCDKKPHLLPVHLDNATTVTINGLKAPTLTAWFATILTR